jgi:hypothetical protein
MSNGSDTSVSLGYDHRIAGITILQENFETAEHVPFELSITNFDTTTFGGSGNCINADMAFHSIYGINNYLSHSKSPP